MRGLEPVQGPGPRDVAALINGNLYSICKTYCLYYKWNILTFDFDFSYIAVELQASQTGEEPFQTVVVETWLGRFVHRPHKSIYYILRVKE